jgi:hypothetical protein
MVFGLGTATLALLIGSGDSVAIGFCHGMGIDQPSWYLFEIEEKSYIREPVQT